MGERDSCSPAADKMDGSVDMVKRGERGGGRGEERRVKDGVASSEKDKGG